MVKELRDVLEREADLRDRQDLLLNLYLKIIAIYVILNHVYKNSFCKIHNFSFDLFLVKNIFQKANLIEISLLSRVSNK